MNNKHDIYSQIAMLCYFIPISTAYVSWVINTIHVHVKRTIS